MYNFLPFIGSQYENSTYGVRILVLGLSHYGEPDDSYPEFTRDIIAEHAYSAGNRFFTILTNVLRQSREVPEETERKAAWNNVAFYNYIQEIVGDGSRISPTNEMWRDATQPFLNLVEELKPKVILVLGTQLWDQLPEIDGIEWCWIKHPSSTSFSYEEAFKNFSKSLDSVKVKKYFI